MKIYRHVQFSWLAFFILVPILLFLTTLILSNDARWVVLTPFLLAAFVLVNFLWQTIEVDQETIRIRLGPGLVRFSFSLQEIENLCIVQSSRSERRGVRATARGLLLNIYNQDAVELDFRDGNLVKVGTDEPDKLAKAIEDQLIARKSQERKRAT